MVDLVQNQDATPSNIKHLKTTIDRNKTIEDSIVDFIIRFTSSTSNAEIRKIIIFCQMKSEVAKINNCLNANSHKFNNKKASMIHGDIPQRQRDQAMNQFKQGRIAIMVSTDVCARGIDLPDLDLVIQTEPPKDVDSYVHRSGRTGRNGREGTSVCF